MATLRLMIDGVDRVYPLDRPATIIGREQNCDIILPSPAVSRRHVTVFRDGKSYYIKDIRTRSGIFINNEFILHDTGPYLLHDGDRIKICSFDLLFETENLDGPGGTIDRYPLRPEPVTLEPRVY